jgi:rubrerythrin
MDNLNYKEILELAINNEIEAYLFYIEAAKKAKDSNLKAIFNELADEEQSHKRTLEAFLKNDSLKLNFKQSQSDYKVSESVELPPLKADMSFVDGVALAMKKEEEAMEMYTKFADASSDLVQKKIFLELAKMEQGHKVKLEELYNNSAYVEAW